MHFPPTEICTIEFFNSELSVFCHLKRLVEILGTTSLRSWQFLFFLNQEHKNCTTQNHSPTDLVAISTAPALRRTRSQLSGRSPYWRAPHHHCRWSLSSHCTSCCLKPAHLQNAHTTLNLGRRCHPYKTLALGRRCRPYKTLALTCHCLPCKTLALGRCCRPCETLTLGCYCSRNFHVLLINFCWSDI